MSTETKAPMPLTAGNWNSDEWTSAHEATWKRRVSYPPDSLSAIYRDISINLQAELNRQRKAHAEMLAALNHAAEEFEALAQLFKEGDVIGPNFQATAQFAASNCRAAITKGEEML